MRQPALPLVILTALFAMLWSATDSSSQTSFSSRSSSHAQLQAQLDGAALDPEVAVEAVDDTGEEGMPCITDAALGLGGHGGHSAHTGHTAHGERLHK
ncbi:HERV-H LTR-associating protein 2, partial [Frankliniella fusca]